MWPHRRVCRLVAVDSEAELSDGMQADEVLVPPAMLFNLVGPLCQSLPRYRSPIPAPALVPLPRTA